MVDGTPLRPVLPGQLAAHLQAGCERLESQFPLLVRHTWGSVIAPKPVHHSDTGFRLWCRPGTAQV